MNQKFDFTGGEDVVLEGTTPPLYGRNYSAQNTNLPAGFFGAEYGVQDVEADAQPDPVAEAASTALLLQDNPELRRIVMQARNVLRDTAAVALRRGIDINRPDPKIPGAMDLYRQYTDAKNTLMDLASGMAAGRQYQNEYRKLVQEGKIMPSQRVDAAISGGLLDAATANQAVAARIIPEFITNANEYLSKPATTQKEFAMKQEFYQQALRQIDELRRAGIYEESQLEIVRNQIIPPTYNPLQERALAETERANRAREYQNQQELAIKAAAAARNEPSFQKPSLINLKNKEAGIQLSDLVRTELAPTDKNQQVRQLITLNLADEFLLGQDFKPVNGVGSVSSNRAALIYLPVISKGNGRGVVARTDKEKEQATEMRAYIELSVREEPSAEIKRGNQTYAFNAYDEASGKYEYLPLGKNGKVDKNGEPIYIVPSDKVYYKPVRTQGEMQNYSGVENYPFYKPIKQQPRATQGGGWGAIMGATSKPAPSSTRGPKPVPAD